MKYQEKRKTQQAGDDNDEKPGLQQRHQYPRHLYVDFEV
jgi:hypothetical protein